ncbi:MAG: Ig-like domain-containing protein [Planctomycetes bacterium]|nr:Ig-like domain-containing protein [Planctomycetota bacterium]
MNNEATKPAAPTTSKTRESGGESTGSMIGSRRRVAGTVLGRVVVGGGLVAAGAAFGLLLSLPSAPSASAGEHNYVRSASHEAISNVRLDEEVSILFNSALWAPSVGPDTILLRTGATRGEQASGSYVVGRFMYDRSAQRRVVIRPEAIREYYQISKGFSRVDAENAATRFIRNIESTGRTGTLNKVDQALVKFFGASYGAGSRLDDETVFGNFPPVLNAGDPLLPYRTRVAGNDQDYQDYKNLGDFAKFNSLRENSEYERFFHTENAATGDRSDDSVLRERKYRQVMIDRRSANRVMFVPEVPIRPDLTDTGYKTGSAYSVVVPSLQPGVYNTVQTLKGHRGLLQAGGRDYSTYFTTIPGTVASSGLFLDNEARTGLATLQKPRVICVTPPNGETYVDPATDWEDPHDKAIDNDAALKTFSVRLRFSQPLDPRTVTPSNFTIRQVRQGVGTSSESIVSIPKPAGTFLNQHRLGTVEVEVTPALDLEGSGQYEVVVKGLVKSLGGELLNTDYKVSFITGQAEPPLDAIREDFRSAGNQADPLNADTLNNRTTAYWPAPVIYDPAVSTGRAVAKFMPFSGTGVGAPAVPADASSPNVKNLVVAAGESIVFLTEDLDPGSTNFGKQIEYHYQDVSITSATVTTIGRFPLVIRSQTDVLLKATNVLIGGRKGSDGGMNTDTLTGPPTGGLGGDAGPGGFRGGDGAGAALTDANHQIVTDGAGLLQFDQTKFDALDGLPGYVAAGTTAGGGSGGFSGDREAAAVDGDGNGTINSDDYPLTPARFREAGGGAGHATAGGSGAGATGSGKSHSSAGTPYKGGLGGVVYGDANFSTAPINAQGVPTLGAGFGGAGGGGGGMEDDVPLGVVGPEDAGGGGGGGGGGAIQICARGTLTVEGTTIDARGGAGGRTYNATRSSEGQGAPGGCGSGGSIWLQAYEGDVDVKNGAKLYAAGGDPSASTGEITTSRNDTATVPSPIKGKGGTGGEGFIRLEDKDGIFPNLVGQYDTAAITLTQFRPLSDGSYPGRATIPGVAAGPGGVPAAIPAIPGIPMTVDASYAYSRWFDSKLDTPTYRAAYDDPTTVGADGIFGTFDDPIEGTLVQDFAAQSGGNVLIEARAAADDPANSGHPNLFQVSSWVPLDQVGNISDRRFLQFRITFTLPLTYSFANPLPYVDFLQINIETN